MGTSGSFGGSGGADAGDLRDSIAEWLDDAVGAAPADPGSAESHDDAWPADDRPPTPRVLPKAIDLGPTIRILSRSGGRSDGPGGGGGGRATGGPARSVSRMSAAASRAGSLASAYATGDRERLAEAGLNYDELLALGDPVRVGIRIVEASFVTQPDSTIDDGEARDIAAEVVAWILESPPNDVPSPDDIVRKSIELMIAEITLTEVAEKIRTDGATAEDRRSAETMIRDAAEEVASQVNLTASGATEAEISKAIQDGIDQLGRIFGSRS
jgi:hypothetical protein